MKTFTCRHSHASVERHLSPTAPFSAGGVLVIALRVFGGLALPKGADEILDREDLGHDETGRNVLISGLRSDNISSIAPPPR